MHILISTEKRGDYVILTGKFVEKTDSGYYGIRNPDYDNKGVWYDHIRISAQYNASSTGFYAFVVELDTWLLPSINLWEAERALKTLSRIEKGIERYRAKHGIRDVVYYLRAVRHVTKAEGFVVREPDDSYREIDSKGLKGRIAHYEGIALDLLS